MFAGESDLSKWTFLNLAKKDQLKITMKANQAVRFLFVNMETPPLPFSLWHLCSISENFILKWGLPRYTDIIFRRCKLSSMTVCVQLNQDKLDYIKRGWELAKRMLKSECVTCESDGSEIAYINSNWLIKQRASRQQNVHLERAEMIREAVSRKWQRYGRALLHSVFFWHRKPLKDNRTGCSCVRWKSHIYLISLPLPVN